MIKPKILTFTGASGAGKSTIVRELFNELEDLEMVLSLTTRGPREGDLSEHREYLYNLDKHNFTNMDADGILAWTGEAFGNIYGTMHQTLQDALDRRGAFSAMFVLPDRVSVVRGYAPHEVVSFYILSPPEPILRERLESRGDSPEQIEKRIIGCREWDSTARNSYIPYKFVRNDSSVDAAVEQVMKYLKPLR